ncbi:MAG TPA: site-2 protease family protein [Acidimicrobiales bacterium]|jgi:Zn-dependent protease|nr:site-2 protease family protein [Acidimicrobiales bacterium]
MRDSIRLGRIAGVKVGLNWSLPVLAVLLGAGLAGTTLPSNAPGSSSWAYGVAGSLTAVAFIAAILAHELGHAVVARRQGSAVDGITLWALGGLTRIDGEARSPAAEFRISGIGPLVSFALGLGLGAVGLALGALGWSPLVAAAFDWLGAINLILAVFNVLPGAPLDGGRLLHAALWRHHGDKLRATETVSRIGWVLGLALVALGLVGFALSGFGGLWLALVGWFLMTASRAERSQARLLHGLQDLRAVDLMSADPVRSPGWVTVQAFMDDYALAPHPTAFPLEAWSGGLSGLVDVNQLRSVPPAERRIRRVVDVAWPLASVAVVRPDQPATEVAKLMAQSPAGRALVIDGDRLLGIISASDLTSRRRPDWHGDAGGRGDRPANRVATS